ncbi:tetratricopeptide repeat protein [Streptacidiphilus pinicola]|uniref:tetratricopeptide repeat protein n=1 Tax=Streptacidiphilus pinicola TaxID=2219663 RepID=UPI001403FB2D|nr:tetratricopeptide repeat protein [Streptacidiphilus pinicola]
MSTNAVLEKSPTPDVVGEVNADGILVGGPGWGVHQVSQKMVATDPVLLRAVMDRTDNPLNKVGCAIALGALDEARGYLAQSPDTMRKKIFTGDVLREEGRYVEAARHFTLLLDEARGTVHEAVVLQHHGKSLFLEGRYGEAVRYLTDALAGLRADGRDVMAVKYTELCLGEARRRIEAERAGADA